MAQFTKNSIIEYTVEQAQKRPLSKITVREIVNHCGITRNTFYYYFHDIYDVLSEAITAKINELKNQPDKSPEEIVFETLAFCVSYKKVWLNLYKTLGHEKLSRYVNRRMREIIALYIQQELKGERLSERDFDIISGFYEEAIFGLMVRWLKSERSDEDIHKNFERIATLFEGQVALILKNCRKE